MKRSFIVTLGITITLNILNFNLYGENREGFPQSPLFSQKKENLIHLDDALLEYDSSLNWSIQIDDTRIIKFFIKESGSSFTMSPTFLKTALNDIIPEFVYADSICSFLIEYENFESLHFRLIKPIIKELSCNHFEVKGFIVINNKAFRLDGVIKSNEDKTEFDSLLKSFSLMY
ncbi:MAG TPA: hypothetical protein VLZ83_13110 [Edaphocola sp.]|nr:hypothetical protein [Edaphocola sp.]